MLPFGDFNNVLLIETLLMSTISCNTIIFSYDEKILETREYKSCLRGQGTGYIYSFDYCSGYWTAFLNGLQYFSKQQSKRALESLTMFQVLLIINSRCLVLLEKMKRKRQCCVWRTNLRAGTGTWKLDKSQICSSYSNFILNIIFRLRLHSLYLPPTEVAYCTCRYQQKSRRSLLFPGQTRTHCHCLY